MKKLIFLIVVITCLVQAQDITGKWNGILSVQGLELRLVFHMSREDLPYVAKMDRIPSSATNLENSILNIYIAQLGADIRINIKWHRRHFLSVRSVLPLNLAELRVWMKKTLNENRE